MKWNNRCCILFRHFRVHNYRLLYFKEAISATTSRITCEASLKCQPTSQTCCPPLIPLISRQVNLLVPQKQFNQSQDRTSPPPHHPAAAEKAEIGNGRRVNDSPGVICEFPVIDICSVRAPSGSAK